MTDTPAPNDMPDEIYAKRYGQSSGGTYWGKPREGETGTRYIRADLTATVAAGGEALNWKRQKDTVFAWAAEHGFTPVESEIVDLLSALQQPAAPAVDLENILLPLRKEIKAYEDIMNDNRRGDTLRDQAGGVYHALCQALHRTADHLAAQGMIKGRE